MTRLVAVVSFAGRERRSFSFLVFKDCLHLIRTGRGLVLRQLLVSRSHTPAVRPGQAGTVWPAAGWLQVLPVRTSGPERPRETFHCQISHCRWLLSGHSPLSAAGYSGGVKRVLTPLNRPRGLREASPEDALCFLSRSTKDVRLCDRRYGVFCSYSTCFPSMGELFCAFAC